MRVRFGVISILLLCLCVALWTFSAPSGAEADWTQKLTVHYTIDGSESTMASYVSVRATETDNWWTLPEARGVKRPFHGEAAYSLVSPNTYLVALLKGPKAGSDPNYLLFTVLGREEGYQDIAPRIERIEMAIASARGKVYDVPQDYWPYIIVLKDDGNDRWARSVMAPDSETSLHSQVTIMRVTVELTEATVHENNLLAKLSYYSLSEAEQRQARCDAGDCQQPIFTISTHWGGTFSVSPPALYRLDNA